MATMTDEQPTKQQVSAEIPKRRTPPGHRVLHLVIDQGTFDLIHMCALKSRMKFTAYMQRFLREAFPYELSEVSTAAGNGANGPSEPPVVAIPNCPAPPGC